MDTATFQKLLELLERESSACIASEEARIKAEITRAEENIVFGRTIANLNATIQELKETMNVLLEENRLLKGPKKNSSNSSMPPSKDENRAVRTSSLRKSNGKRNGGLRNEAVFLDR